MKKFYTIECYNQLFNIWIRHNFNQYNSLQEAQKEVKSYKEHKLGVKFRIIKAEIIK